MRLTLLGTGVRTPYLLHGLSERAGELGLSEVVLHDVDPDRLDVMRALGASLVDEWGAPFSLHAEPEARPAIAGSDFVFSAIRVGQDRARELDEEIALKHGVIGQETTGPAGFAMALRTIPAVLELAGMIEEESPDALLVNFTNPVGIVMQALTEHRRVRAVGVCDGPIEMKRSVAALLRVPPDELEVSYFGLNHCGWIHRVAHDGEDRLPEILDRYEELREAEDSWRLFDAELVRTLGMLPMEYLYFYYYRSRAVENVLRSGGTRGEQIAMINESLWPAMRERVSAGDLSGARRAWEEAMESRGVTYFARERGELELIEDSTYPDDPPIEMFEGDGYEGLAIAVMTATVQRRRTPLIVNAPNGGAMPELRDDDIVEVTSEVDEGGAHPLPQGPMPPAARALVEPVKEYERLTVQAAIEGSYDKALQALLVHPLVGSYPLARSILDEYLAVHPDLLG